MSPHDDSILMTQSEPELGGDGTSQPRATPPASANAELGGPGEASAPSSDGTISPLETHWPTLWGMALALSAVAATAAQIAARSSGREIQGVFILSLAFLTIGAAALCDSATRRIPNVLTYPALLIALAINVMIVPGLERFFPTQPLAAWFGAPTWDEAILGFVLCTGLGVVSFMFRGLGGGDVKLIAACGAMLGFPAIGAVLFNALVFACVIGLANLAFKGDLVRKVQMLSMNLQVNLAMRKRALDAYPFGKTEAPFGLAMLLGLLTAQWMPFWEPLLEWLSPGMAPPPG
jgi:prepilin peptidase CpaA